MITFVLSAIALSVLALMLLFFPFWRKLLNKSSDPQNQPNSHSNSHERINALLHKQELQQLEQERASGSLSEADYLQAKQEIQRRVLEEVQSDSSHQSNQTIDSALKTPRKTMLFLIAVLPALSVLMYAIIGNPAAWTQSANKSTQNSAHESGATSESNAVTSKEMEVLVEGLAQKLEKEPNNFKGWTMLARSYKVLGRFPEAEKAFAKAGSFIDNDAQLLVDYADVAATNANGRFEGVPEKLIEKALKVDPNNPMAMWLSGTVAMTQAKYDQAIAVWERLLAMLEPNSEDAIALQNAINDAKYLGAQSKSVLSQNIKNDSNKSNNQADNQGKSSSALFGIVSGKIEIDESLKNQVVFDDVLMVIARPVGSKMPVAVLRTPLTKLPMSFQLDDSMSMNPQAKLSQLPEVEIDVRISRTGMAQAESGDLFSSAQKIAVGSQNVRLLVNQVRP